MEKNETTQNSSIIQSSKNIISNVLNNNEKIEEKVKAYGSYTEFLKSINESDNLSTKEVFNVLKQELENNKHSDEFNLLAKKVIDDHSKALNNSTSFEEKEKILNSEKDIFEKALEHEKQKEERNKEITNEAIEIDKQHKSNNWNKLKVASVIVISIVGGALGYKFIDKK